MMGLASGSHGQPVKLYQLSSNPCRSLLSFSFISSHTETLSILILPKRGGGGAQERVTVMWICCLGGRTKSLECII